MSRKSTFNAAEVNKLFEISEKFKKIIECKRSDCITTKQKNEAWDKIAAEFNATNDIAREAKDLKTKYKNVRSATKAKSAEVRKNIYGTGGGPATECSTLSALEERMLSMITETEMDGVRNTCDSNIAAKPSTEQVDVELCSDKTFGAANLETPMPGTTILRAKISTPLRTGAKTNKATSWEKLAEIKTKWTESKLQAELVLVKKLEEKDALEMKLIREKHELETRHMCERYVIEVDILRERLEKEKLEVLKLQKF